MSSKIRSGAGVVRTLNKTFASTDRVSGNFEWIAAEKLIVHFMDDVDVSEDGEASVCYECDAILVPKQAGTAWEAGAPLFYTPGGNTFHTATTSAKDVIAGTAVEDAASAATEAIAHFRGDRAGRARMPGAGL